MISESIRVLNHRTFPFADSNDASIAPTSRHSRLKEKVVSSFFFLPLGWLCIYVCVVLLNKQVMSQRNNSALYGEQRVIFPPAARNEKA